MICTIEKNKIFFYWTLIGIQLNSHFISKCEVIDTILKFVQHKLLLIFWIFLSNFHFFKFYLQQYTISWLKLSTATSPPPEKSGMLSYTTYMYLLTSSIGDKTSCFPYCCHECWIYETIYERITHSVYKVKVEHINIELNDFQFHHPRW